MKFKKVQFLIILMLLVLLALFTFVNSYIKLNLCLTENTYMNLKSSNENNVSNFKNKLSNQYDSLKYLANFIEAKKENSEIINLAIDQTVLKSDFEKIAIIDSNGYEVTHTNQNFGNVSNYSFFKQAMAGITSIYNQEIAQKKYLIVSTPIYKDKQAVAALIATYKKASISNHFILSTYKETGLSYIISKDGNIIIENSEQYSLPKSENLLDLYKNYKFKNKNSLDIIKNKLENGTSGISSYKINDKEIFVHYMPIGINDWYIFNTVPKKIVSNQSNIIFAQTIYLSFIMFLCSLLLLWYIYYSFKNNNKIIDAKTKELEVLTSNIPCGIVKTKIDTNNEIIYANDSFLEMVCCSFDELKNEFNYNPFNCIIKKGLEDMEGKAYDSLIKGQYYHCDFRLKKKNGESIWVVVYGHFITDEKGEKIAIWVLFDNNEQKLSQDKIKIIAEKYKILADYSESIIFEIDVASGSVKFNSNFKKILGRDPIKENFINAIPHLDIFHADDLSIFVNALIDVVENKKSVVTEMRMKNANGAYLWHCARIAPVTDEKTNVITIVGRISSIDKQKKETEQLLIKSQLDSLTNLYNKASTQVLIDDFLKNQTENNSHAMLAIDIDGFKAINDNLGHLFGDAVLMDVASMLKELFRDSDIIGRFGGDEFIVFLKNIPSEKFVLKRSEDILNIFRRTYFGDNIEYKISASIGISFYDKHGKTFSDLYEKADYALYTSKHNGKNQYFVYVEDDTHQETFKRLRKLVDDNNDLNVKDILLNNKKD